MFKLIFFLIIIGLFIVLFNDAIIDTSTMMAVAITSLSGAFTLILSIVIVPFTVMLDFYYIKLALYIGLFIFTLSYILKWLTGHHLTSEEDIEEYESTDYLDKKEVKILPIPTRSKDIYSSKQTYDPWHNIKVKYAKNQNRIYESSLRKQKEIKIKNYERESRKVLEREIAEWKERRKKK